MKPQQQFENMLAFYAEHSVTSVNLSALVPKPSGDTSMMHNDMPRTLDEAVKALPWARSENAAQHDIYIRPARYDPVTGKQLASNAGASHKAGWDLTFSAPKSVSVAWAFADMEMQSEIAAAHDAAVRAGLDYLEKNAFSSRDRSGERPLQGIIAATYQHSTSREQDPQLHTHAAVANIGLRFDGTPCAIDFDSRWKIAAGAIYRAELANQLQKLGLDIERDAKSFRLSAIPESLCKTFSKRRNQIEEHLQKSGFTSAKAADIAALATRRAKEVTERAVRPLTVTNDCLLLRATAGPDPEEPVRFSSSSSAKQR